MALAFGIDQGLMLKLTTGFSFVSSNRVLSDVVRVVQRRLESEYNAHRQMMSQRWVAVLARGRLDRAFICKYEKTPNECTVGEISRCKDSD